MLNTQKLSPFAESIFKRTYAFTPNETWEECAYRVASAVAFTTKQKEIFFELIRDRILMPGGRYLYSAGRELFMNSNCYGFMVEDSREDWARLLHDCCLCLSTGGGLGVNYSNIRPRNSPIVRTGGVASGPTALMQMVNEVARHVMSGGKRRSALWAGLKWDHPDIQEFIAMKDWDIDLRVMKAKNFEYPAPLDMTNVSVIVDDTYIKGLNSETSKLHLNIIEHMARTGEPAFRNQTLILRDDPLGVTGNACQESTLADRDTCNLASIVMPRVGNLTHLEYVVRAAIQFLLNGSILGQYPTTEIKEVARQNRRLGLGIMGLHEWLLERGRRYEWDLPLEVWFKTYAEVANEESTNYANYLNERIPVTTRAIAPTGTISIVGETTSGIEPVYCVAYKRRYIDGDVHKFQYVVDPTVRRLLELGIKPKEIEDTYELSKDIRRRLTMQAGVQQYVDQGISNTVNLAGWGTPDNNNPTELARIVSEYLPRLKGLTFYPNGARSGQPLNPVPLEEAIEQEGVVFEEDFERCIQGVCGI